MKNLKKILAVDDSELIHNMYRVMLKSWSEVQILKSKNGHEALETLAKNPDVSIILLDINMPVMNGLDFLKTLKAQEAFKHIPVIMISTEGKEEDTQRAVALGASNYITKPFQASQLQAAIEKTLK